MASETRIVNGGSSISDTTEHIRPPNRIMDLIFEWLYAIGEGILDPRNSNSNIPSIELEIKSSPYFDLVEDNVSLRLHLASRRRVGEILEEPLDDQSSVRLSYSVPPRPSRTRRQRRSAFATYILVSDIDIEGARSGYYYFIEGTLRLENDSRIFNLPRFAICYPAPEVLF